MTTILLIRHGESVTNRLKRFTGQLDVALNELGHMQAKKTAEFVTANYSIDRIYSSDLSRAYDTAKPISEIVGRTVTKIPELREICVGVWQGYEHDEIEKKFPEDIQRWRNSVIDFAPEKGESRRQLSVRSMKALTDIAKENDGKTIAVATHGGVIRAVQAIIARGGIEHFSSMPITPNASVTVITYENGVFSLGDINICAHLDHLNAQYENGEIN